MLLHHNRTFLPPDALGGVICLDIGGHPILHGTGDVLLDNVGTVVSERGGKTVDGFINFLDIYTMSFLESLQLCLKHNIERKREQVLRDTMSRFLLNKRHQATHLAHNYINVHANLDHFHNHFSPSSPAACLPPFSLFQEQINQVQTPRRSYSNC